MMLGNIESKIKIGPSDRLFVLTGAGISAESGLKTFRDGGGLWAGHRVESVATPEAWENDPELVWRFYSQRRRDAMASQPNAAHSALAELERQLGERFFLCTQNVDDLHERAGSTNMVHMHGELFKSRCEDNCGGPVLQDEGSYESLDQIPKCKCGGRIRPHIVWFGEIPFGMPRIEKEIERCTMLLVVGTSGAVYPAASFVHWARRRAGSPARTFYIGPEEPLNVGAFTEVILGKAGERLPGLFEVE